MYLFFIPDLAYFLCEAALDADTIMSGMDAVLLQYEFAEEGSPTLLCDSSCVWQHGEVACKLTV